MSGGGPDGGAVRDGLGRPLRDLRISVTDRCNLRCPYCMPREVYGERYRFLERRELLSFEEIARLAAAFARLGVRKLRLTGGEPLLRRDLATLVEMLAATPGVEDLALTTNGLLLARHADGLAAAGLRRVTVSLDALEDDVLARMSDARVSSSTVLAGIDAALAAGLEPVKVNMVVRRDVNEGSVVEMARRFRHRPVVLRFIEYMDVGTTNGWRRDQVLDGEEIIAALSARWPLRALPASTPGEVASRYSYADGGGEIGIVRSISAPFCASCTRARLSADGRLFTCLFAETGSDLRALLRSGAGDDQLERRLRRLWGARGDRYSAARAEREAGESARLQVGGAGGGRAKVEMSYIGG